MNTKDLGYHAVEVTVKIRVVEKNGIPQIGGVVAPSLEDCLDAWFDTKLQEALDNYTSSLKLSNIIKHDEQGMPVKILAISPHDPFDHQKFYYFFVDYQNGEFILTKET